MTSVQVQKVATIGQVILGGIILMVQVAGLIRGRSTVKTHVGPEAS